MSDQDRTRALADRLLAGVTALREGRPHDAARALTEVADDPELRQASDLVDVRARACSLLAQALLDGGAPREARPWLDEAARLLRELDDADGLREVRQLQARAVEAVSAQVKQAQASDRAARLAATPLSDLLAKVRDPDARVELLVQKANAELEAQRPSEAVVVAEQALTEASARGNLRGEVLARLSIARAAPERADAVLREAFRRAEAASEHTLVTAVARAAELSGVRLPVQQGPDLRSREP